MPTQREEKPTIKVWSHFIDILENCLSLLWATRASLLVVIVTLIVCRTGQFIDVLRVILEQGFGTPRLALAFIFSFILLIVSIWYWTPISFVVPSTSSARCGLYRKAQANMGVIYAVALSAIVTISLLKVQTFTAEQEISPDLINTARIIAASISLIGVLFIVGFKWFGKYAPSTYGRPQKFFAACLFAVWVGLALLFTRHNQWTALWGPFALVTFTLALWVPMLCSLTYFEQRFRSPVSIAICLWSLFLNARGLNDNTELEITSNRKGLPPVFAQTFTDWLKERPDKHLYSKPDQAYPVFIVAIEGGGMRSAYMGALLLSRIQDHEPRFAQHVFAISGVSGGSLGAAVFASLTDKYVAKPRANDGTRLPWNKVGQLEGLTEEILKQDLLSPVLASGLYSSVLQQVVPWVIPHSDPGQALETGLESAWKRATKEDFPSGFYGLSDNLPEKATPALFFNTTSVEDGERMLLSNLYFLESNTGRFSNLADVIWTADMKLSSAAVLGARFPGVTPSAYLRNGEGNAKQRFVDGGYYENSGCATALDIFNAMQYSQYIEDRPRFYPIFIRIGYDTSTSPKKSDGWEFFSPIKTLIKSRDGRGTTATQQLRVAADDMIERENATSSQFPEFIPVANRTRMIEFEFKSEKSEVPLGWVLSENSRTNIKVKAKAPKPSNAYIPGDIGVALDQVVEALHPQ